MVQTADVVVVGGGVNGTSIAYALASKGAKCVLVRRGRRERAPRPIERARAHAYTNEWDARLAWASFQCSGLERVDRRPPVFTQPAS